MGDPDGTAVDAPDASVPAGLLEELARVRAERDEATATCRRLEHELGVLRGQTKRLELQVYRRMARRERWLRRGLRVAGWLRVRRR